MNVELSTTYRMLLPAELAVVECYPLGFSDLQLGAAHKRADIGKLNLLRKELDLKYSVHAPLPTGAMVDPASRSKRVRDASLKAVRKSIENANELESDYVVVHIGTSKEKDDAKDCIASFVEYCDYAKQYSMQICIENEAKEMFGAHDPEYVSIFREIKKQARNARVCFDINHAMTAEKTWDATLDFVRDVKKDLGCVHIAGDNPEWDEHAPFYNPLLFDQLIRLLLDANYKGNLVLEMFETIPEDQVVEMARFVRAALIDKVAEGE